MLRMRRTWMLYAVHEVHAGARFEGQQSCIMSMLFHVPTWMISAVSGPMRCTPTTLSLSAATRIFMKPRPSLPDSVFFMGLQQRTADQ